MRFGLIILAALVITASGCSSGGGSAAGAKSTAAPTGLSGFGASRDEWDAGHTSDPDPALQQGCCYEPQIALAGQSSLADTWVAVTDHGGIIDGFSHNFAPHTSRSTALADITAHDLPKDATLVRSIVGDGCELFLYRSAALGAADPDLGSYISFDFVSPPDQTVYYPDNIWFASVTASSTLGAC